MVVHHPHHPLTRPRPGKLLATAVALVAAAVCASCAGDGDRAGVPSSTATPSSHPSSSDRDGAAAPTSSAAVAAGAAWVAPQLDSIDVASASLFDYLYRNWGVAGLEQARPGAERRAAAGGLVDDEVLLVRLVRPEAPFPADLAGAERTTRVLVDALHCDTVPPDAAAEARLRDLAAGGGYDTTHAALAVGWLRELGCPVPAGVDAGIVDAAAAELASTEEVTDLAVEQSSVLIYLGAGDRVPADWSDRVRAAQRDDGGWGPGPSTWHMTLLAMWTLSGAAAPGAGVPMVTAAG